MSLDVIAIGKAQKYTDDSIEGYSDVIKGKNCVVSSTVIEGGHRVTVGWYRDSDDAYQEFYFDVIDGVDGVQPVLSIGTVTKGTTASATITGTAADPKLNLVLPQGDTGVGIVSIAKTDTSGITDTYTVTYDNGNTDTFTVTNGDSVVSASVDELNNLSFTMASGADINAGRIQLKGQQGYIPCGTRMSYYGTTAPLGFLLCDGTEYLKSDYPQLAALLAATDTAQSTTHFAGSDAQHFKVPDLRGEYTRGSGTNSHTNQGSGGNIGEHQDATVVPTVYFNASGINVGNINRNFFDTNNDGIGSEDSSFDDYTQWVVLSSNNKYAATNMKAARTVRPTGTSENMIIAYQDIYLAPRHQYSTEEHVVGTWIDGRPIYEKTFTGTMPASGGQNLDFVITSDTSMIDTVIDVRAVCRYGNNNVNAQIASIYFSASDYFGVWFVENSKVRIRGMVTSKPVHATVRYTKTTDIVS